MPITRRSLLQTFGALSAAWHFRAFAASRDKCLANPPSPTSAFILLGGPWLIFPNSGNATLTALSADASMDSGDFDHYCVLQKYHAGKNPQACGYLDAGDYVKTAASNADPANFFNVFDQAFQKNPFIWTNTDITAKIDGSERYLSLPVANQIHIAGLLVNAQVSGSGYRKNQTVLPHIVTILEYSQPQAGSSVSLSITPSNGASIQLGPADQLVVSMFHGIPLTASGPGELKHMQDSFTYIRNHLKGDGNGVNVTYKDAKYSLGDCDGFNASEMDLSPQGQTLEAAYNKAKRIGRIPIDATYSNCCGGGIVAGPGH
jgi:hypothetical protein